jgi:hypothetical protein
MSYSQRVILSKLAFIIAEIGGRNRVRRGLLVIMERDPPAISYSSNLCVMSLNAVGVLL